MFFLYTGQGGSKKTASMINLVLNDSQFKDRPVYYYNIKGCKVEDWIELSSQEVLDWPNILPEGAVFLIDECQTIWRTNVKNNPIYITALETSRHQGWDIIATTQHPMLIHPDVRRQVHYHRHFFSVYHFWYRNREWKKCVNDPDSFHAKKDALISTTKVPKSVFDVYKSTSFDTHKKRIPPAFYIAFLFLVGLGFYAYRILSPDPVVQKESTSVISTVGNTIDTYNRLSNPKKASGFPLNKKDYLEMFKPRVEGLAHTAPFYDQLQVAVSFPRTQCIRIYRGGEPECSCYTQQATALDVPDAMCNSLVERGLFDHTRPDQVKKQQPTQNQGREVVDL